VTGFEPATPRTPCRGVTPSALVVENLGQLYTQRLHVGPDWGMIECFHIEWNSDLCAAIRGRSVVACRQ